MRGCASFVVQCCVLLSLAACSPQEAATAENADRSARYLDETALRAQGLKTEALGPGRALWCDPASKRCVCHEPLDCGADGKGCLMLGANIETFRDALARGQDGRRVDCRRAEVGTCGDFRYFLFNGDIERRELRWFDGQGHLVAMRNRTDYPAYCDGRAMTRVLGRLPNCAPMARTELICGEAGPEGFSALDDALARAPSRR